MSLAEDRMVRIEELIAELQEIHRKFGNTCCYVSGLAWGSVALWRETWHDRLKAEPTDAVIEEAARSFCNKKYPGGYEPLLPDEKARVKAAVAAAIAAYRKAVIG